MTNIDLLKSCITYNADELLFSITNDDCELEYHSVLNIHPHLDPKKFDCYLLHNNRDEVSENSIYRVYFDNIRGGWIFPIQALVSKEHDYVDDEFFLQYAYLGMYFLLSSYSKDDIISDSRIETKYDTNDHLLLIDHDNIKRINNFTIKNYVVSLFKYGYGFNNEGNTISENILIPEKNMKLASIPSCINNNVGINFLFTELINKKESEYSLFYVLYQLIELLISKVLLFEFKKQVLTIDWDETNLFDKNDSINKAISEKSRIKALFNTYSNPDNGKVENLSNVCRNFLLSSNYDTETTLKDKTCVDYFYRVRCCLVHSLYKYDTSTAGLLANVNKCFLDVIMDILLTFKEN